ncbi:hypothetical protein BT69DRAFT_1211220 [Atractiella rhizophila]|nr:hypothetical protein BT69DRAFT_1211220 [Atractiella rhizophila]
MTFKVFAIAGISGVTSKTFLQSFLDLPTVPKIYILTRQDKPEIPFHPNVIVVKVDYTSRDTIAAALQGKGIEVLISTFGGNHGTLLSQEPLVKAAKKEGIKLFVPWNMVQSPKSTENTPLADKLRIQKLAEAEVLPTAVYNNGLFSEHVHLIFGMEKVRILNEGNGHVSITSSADVGRFLAWSLTTLPEQQLYNSTWRLEGDRLNVKQIAVRFPSLRIAHIVSQYILRQDLLKNKYGGEIVHVQKDDLPLTPDFPGFINFFQRYVRYSFFNTISLNNNPWQVDEGCGTTTFDLGPNDSSDRINAVKVWPEWKPEKFEKYLSTA